MPLVTDEQAEKREGLFLKYESTNRLVFKSNLYKVTSHYLKTPNKFVACHGEGCVFCKEGARKKVEYNYLVNLNGQEGVLDVKPSVFFDINQLEKAIGKDKKHIKWMILKSGSGLDTTYTTSKDENLTEEEVTQQTEELKANNDKLAKLMSNREEILEKEYAAQSGNPVNKADLETAPGGEEEVDKATPDGSEDVDTDDLPF